MLESKGGILTEVSGVILMFVLFDGVFYSFLLLDVHLSATVFLDFLCVFCFGAAGGSNFLINSHIFLRFPNCKRGPFSPNILTIIFLWGMFLSVHLQHCL